MTACSAMWRKRLSRATKDRRDVESGPWLQSGAVRRKQAMTDFQIEAVTRDNWPDLEALFESRGGPKYCWCMAWRPMDDGVGADNAQRKRALQSRVKGGTPIGLLGYVQGEPVAWCSVAPRETFTRLRDDQQAEDGVWSITCFFVRRDHRGKDLSERMLDAAVELATAKRCPGRGRVSSRSGFAELSFHGLPNPVSEARLSRGGAGRVAPTCAAAGAVICL